MSALLQVRNLYSPPRNVYPDPEFPIIAVDVTPSPKLVDADKNPLDCKVGNGSDVTVQCRPYDWTFGDRSGRNLDLQAVQVNNLIEYEGTSVDGEELGLDDNEDELEF